MGRRHRIPILGLAALASLLVVYAIGCGGGSSTPAAGGGGSVAVTGILGTGYSVTPASPESVSPKSVSDGVVNRVTALPNFGGVLNADSITQAKTASVAADGSFSLSLENDRNWILVLEDTEAGDLTERFVGYVALKVDPASSLLSLPVSAANTTSLNLGTISKSGDTGITDNAATTSDFTLTSDQLGTLARTDDLFKSVKNLVINYDGTTGSYIIPMPTFEFRGNYGGMDNQFASASDYSYRSYQISLLPNMPGFTIDNVCGAGKVKLALFPPAGASVTDRLATTTYDNTHPISNDFAECSTASDGAVEADEPTSTFPPAAGVGDFYASNREASLGYPVGLEFGRGGGDGLIDNVPVGYWRYEVDNVVKGRFDIAVASPWSGGIIKAVVPVLRVNRDATTGLISSIDIKWYRPNDTYTGYVQLTDITVLTQLVEFTVIELENYSGTERRYENNFIDPSTVTSYTPTGTWYWGGTHPADNTLEASGIHLSYGSGGVNLFFSNHNPH